MPTKKAKAKFIEPMLLLRTDDLPNDRERWQYELKVDGYRAIAFKTGGEAPPPVAQQQRFHERYPGVLEDWRSSRTRRSSTARLSRSTPMGGPRSTRYKTSPRPRPQSSTTCSTSSCSRAATCEGSRLEARRELLERRVLPKLAEPMQYLRSWTRPCADLIASVKAQGLEGLVAKRRDSRYEPGLRSGAWQKMRVNHGQEFVIGGYTVGGKTFDALVFGYYEGDRLIYAARTRNGFTPVVRAQLMKRFRAWKPECPFANLPEKKSGRWGAGLTAAKMKDCRWLKPVLVGQFEFVEWTGETICVIPRSSRCARSGRRNVRRE